MKRKTKRNSGRNINSAWKLPAITAAVILGSGVMVSAFVYKGILDWDTAAFIMKAVAAVTSGLSAHRCFANPWNRWSCFAGLLLGTITILLIIESAFGGQAIWNPLPGIAVSGSGYIAGILWAIWNNTSKQKKKARRR